MPPKRTQGLGLNQLLDIASCLDRGLKSQATIHLGQESPRSLLEDSLELLKAQLARGVQPLVAKMLAIRRGCLAHTDIQGHACHMTQDLGLAAKEGGRLVPTLLHVRKDVHVESCQDLLNTLRASLELQEVNGRHLVISLELLVGQHQLCKNVVVFHTLFIGNSRKNHVLQILVPHNSQGLKQCQKRNRLVIPGSRNDGHTLATAFCARRYDQKVRLGTNGTIVGDGANARLGFGLFFLLGRLHLQRRSMLNQCLGTAFPFAYIGTLASLVQVIAQTLLGKHDLLGSSNDEIATQFLVTLTCLKGLFGFQLGQPALAAAKHERNLAHQNIVKGLRQDLSAHGVLHQELSTDFQQLGTFVQAADMGHNGLTRFVFGGHLLHEIAFTASPEGTQRTSIFQLQGLWIRCLQKLWDLLGQEGILGIQVVANQWKPRVAKQAVQKFPRDLHFLDD